MINIYEVLTNRLMEKRLSLAKCCRLSLINRETFYQIKNHNNPTIKSLACIVNALGGKIKIVWSDEGHETTIQ